MALDTPNSPSDIERDMKTDFQRELVSSNPFLPNSWISALISGFSNRLFDNYITLNQVVDIAFYDTSPEAYLERQASWYDVFRLDATQASGQIVATGIATTVIPFGTSFVSSDGITAVTDAAATITAKSGITPSSLTSTGITATLVFSSEHELSSGVQMTVAGADQEAYNGTFDVNVIDNLTVKYTMDSDPVDTATGTIVVSYTSAIIACTTSDFSDAANLEGNSLVTLSGSIAGVDSDAYVYVDGFAGGSDQEAIETFRDRFLLVVRNPVANFNVSAIETQAREISGVTRVWVQEVTPAIGQVTIYFTRDNDDDIIPSAAEAEVVKDNILLIKPANTADVDVIVDPLGEVSTVFTFNSITPDTTTMREAVENSLDEFFRTTPDPEENVTEIQYNTAIQNTVDLNTGERITSFDLASPSIDIVVAASSGDIATLGGVVMP